MGTKLIIRYLEFRISVMGNLCKSPGVEPAVFSISTFRYLNNQTFSLSKCYRSLALADSWHVQTKKFQVVFTF